MQSLALRLHQASWQDVDVDLSYYDLFSCAPSGLETIETAGFLAHVDVRYARLNMEDTYAWIHKGE